MLTERCECTKCHWITWLKWCILCYVNFTSIKTIQLLKKNFSLSCNLNGSFTHMHGFVTTCTGRLENTGSLSLQIFPMLIHFITRYWKKSHWLISLPTTSARYQFSKILFFCFFWCENILTIKPVVFFLICQAHNRSVLRKCGPNLRVWIIIICLSSFQGKTAFHEKSSSFCSQAICPWAFPQDSHRTLGRSRSTFRHTEY